VSKNLSWRLGIVGALIVIAFICLTPTISKDLPKWWFFGENQIQLGLDLQGGMHLVLEVDVDKAVEADLEREIEYIKDTLKEEKIRYSEISPDGISGINITLLEQEHVDVFKDLADRDYPQFEIKSDGRSLHMVLDSREKDDIRQMAVDQALETIRNRIDQFGVTEERAKDLLGKTAQLEFRLVDDVNSLEDAIKGNMPPGREILKDEQGDMLLVLKRTSLTGEYLTDARVAFDQYNEPYVSLTFNSKGGKSFERITGEHIGERLAIVLDNKIHSAPNIQDKISGGRAQISGRFSLEEAKDLAIVLRAGALPAPVKILEERTVGPSLGQDSIDKGIKSMIIGGIFVILFMIVYYGFAGIVADLALVLNIFFITAVMSAFSATLTLPGIAGMILTVGMAVDANVLVFERIKEELRLGKTTSAAIDGGYGKAIVTILDANVTTLIAALVLFQFGTGPIRGFAVTLSIGIIASFITAVFVTRVVFNYLLTNLNWKSISFSSPFYKSWSEKFNINFISKRRFAFILSVAMIFVTCCLLVWRNGPNYGVDFSGGVMVRVKFDSQQSTSAIREALRVAQLQDSTIQESNQGGDSMYLIRASETDGKIGGLREKIKGALTGYFGGGVEIQSVDMVGPKVGNDLRQKAMLAIFYALLFIAIYISGRFELKWTMSIVMAVSLFIVVSLVAKFNISMTWLIVVALLVTIGLCWFLKLKYAMGAIIALIHDVAITVGVFALTDREISLAIIAAFLTIVGYSLNDTIVVFDRIRENLKRFQRKSLIEVMNISINETLSRTILTSLTTFIVVVSLFVLGGGVIHDFAFAILIGILVGTYSSIFVASPILLLWERKFAGNEK